ncbi:LytR family transcriptional regulator [Salipaludibacillus keqinensis]|uniref:Polyisoprenyl-teichoic acid--peptidoglycan teichoic acid transferase TagU n=1 Tax=Salipaludibacillus keqinensis TaxID=2045207 RepID=A0A323TCN9_9BACI|nr:LCP family protein [Salipaludibacillus keqinensis]PYZ92570.1 LytR family transcriptional regulator [Salipaludibacillus keqinensis]
MRKALIIIGSVLLLFIVAVGGYGFYLYKSVQSTVNSDMHAGLEREKSEKRELEVDMDDREPVSFLLLGIDAEDSTSGRTDTMMVITVNPEDESMRMVSLPRDTRMEIVGRGVEDKVNHAYAFGGADMAVATVENYFDIPIDYFLTVNMEGFKDMVDAVGGVAVNNSFSFNQSGYEFNEGELFLDGDEALAYARMRQEDSRGDLGRNERQRQIVNGMIREGASLSSITRAESILDAMGSNMLTNLTFDKMIKLQQNYADARHSQETMEMTGDGQRIDGIWYLIVPDEERNRISSELRAHLGVDGGSVAVNDEDEETDE